MMQIHERISFSGKKIAVIPTANVTQKRIDLLIGELQSCGVDTILVEDRLPEFSFSKSMNRGIGKALQYNPSCIILSNDDVHGIDGLESMIDCAISNHTYVQPYVNGKRPVYHITSIPLRVVWNYGVAKRAPLFAMNYAGKLVYKRHFIVGIPVLIGTGIVSVQPFGVFDVEILRKYRFDEGFRNYVEDDELGYRLYKNGIIGVTKKEWKISHDGSGTFHGFDVTMASESAHYFYRKWHE
jgi:GT2 family glycosyltransferase